jgi:AcrR family transcriptional regulator
MRDPPTRERSPAAAATPWPRERASPVRAKAKHAYHHGDLKRVLIEAAIKAVAKRGVAALNLRELAARAGVTSGAPYHHFSGREELLAAIAEEGFRLFEEDLTAARDQALPDASARLAALGGAYLAFAIAHPGYFRVMFHGLSLTSGPAAAGRRASGLLREAILACQGAGAAPPGDPQPLVLAAWSTVHGLATLWIDGALPFKGLDGERMATEIGGLIARMFAALARGGGAVAPASARAASS